jgi:hypothetical protein
LTVPIGSDPNARIVTFVLAFVPAPEVPVRKTAPNTPRQTVMRSSFENTAPSFVLRGAESHPAGPDRSNRHPPERLG